MYFNFYFKLKTRLFNNPSFPIFQPYQCSALYRFLAFYLYRNYASGIKAIASISTKKSGCANAAINNPLMTGGFFRPPRYFCEA